MERILIVEDDASVREELSSLLSARGYMPMYAPPMAGFWRHCAL